MNVPIIKMYLDLFLLGVIKKFCMFILGHSYPSVFPFGCCIFFSVPTWAFIQANVRCLTSRASVSMYSNAGRTDFDVILGLFSALIAACESDSIFM